MNLEEIMRLGYRASLLVPVIVAACGGVNPVAPIDAPTRTVNVERSHAGSGTVTSTVGGIACGTTCSASVHDGTVMTLTAVADASAVFAGWSGPCSDPSPTCTFTVHSDVTVGAAFDVKQHTVIVEFAGNGTGMVTGAPGALSCPGACSVSVDDGTQITLTAAAQADSVFLGWSGSGCTGTGPCALTVTSDQTVTATFAGKDSLIVTKSGSGTGTVTSSPAGIACGSDCSEVYAPGTVVTLTAAAGSGSRFAGWTGGGCTGTGTCVVTVNAAMMVVAQFDRLCTLTVARLGTGSGTVTSNPSGISCGADCTEDFVCGTAVQLTAAPNGSTFIGWSNGCSGTGACSVTLTTSTTINATFTQCGGIGQPCCATGPQCGSGSGCLANICTICPQTTTTLLNVFDVGANSNCFNSVDVTKHYGGPCTPGMQRHACQTAIVSAPANAFCNFIGWSSADPTDCGCNIAYHLPQQCATSIECEVTITEAPPIPAGCPSIP